jgi:hypothetical protein
MAALGGAIPAAWAAATVPPTINGVVYVANAAELESLDASLQNVSSPYAAATIDLTANINLQGYAWGPWYRFTGTLNGNGYTIDNPSINANGDVGLIGFLDGGTVTHLGLVNPTVTGLLTSDEGALVGLAENGAALTNVYVQGGTVTAQGFLGPASNLGGVAGDMDGGTVTDAYSTAAVTFGTGVSGSGQNIGGLIGNNDGTVTGGGWDASTATTAVPSAVGFGSTSGITSDTATAMQTVTDEATAFPGWGFPSPWAHVAGQFPTLELTPPTVPLLTVSAAAGTTPGTTALTATPNTAGDTLVVHVGATTPVPVAVGAPPPSGTTAYTSGTNMGPVAVGNIVTVYEVTPAGAVDAATSLTLTSREIQPFPALTITTTRLPAAAVGSPYDETLQTGGGTGGNTWRVTAGTLPVGMTLSSSGALHGTPTATGSQTFTVTVTDSAGATATQALSLTVQPATPPPPHPVWVPPMLISETVTVDGQTTPVIGNLSYNTGTTIAYGSYFGYVEERAAIEAGAAFTGEGTDSSYLSAILSGDGVGLQQHVSAVQQGQFAALYQKLGIIPTWTDNTVQIATGVKALQTTGAAPLAIENYLVQLDGFSWAAAQAQAATGFPLQSQT